MTDDLDVPAPVRAAFAAGPADEPPLGLTPDGLLGSGRRALRRRRAAGTGATAVAVAAVLAGTALLVPRDGADGSRTAATPVPTTAAATTAAPTTTAPTTTAPGTTTPATAAPTTTTTVAPPASLARLTSALRAVVPVPAGARLTGGISPAAGPLEFVPSQGGSKAGATYRDAAGAGDLVVWLDGPVALDDCSWTRTECESWVTSDGSRVTTMVVRQGAVLSYEVGIWRLHGHGVYVSATNSITAGKNPVATRRTPPWTLDQLVKIAQADAFL